MGKLLEAINGCTAHPLTRAICAQPRGMCRLDLDQLFEHQIVGPIVNLCCIEHMVEVVVTIELVHQLIHARARRLYLVRSGVLSAE